DVQVDSVQGGEGIAQPKAYDDPVFEDAFHITDGAFPGWRICPDALERWNVAEPAFLSEVFIRRQRHCGVNVVGQRSTKCHGGKHTAASAADDGRLRGFRFRETTEQGA